MTPSVADIEQALFSWAPKELAESWDNVGLLAGSPAAEARGILLGLDPTSALLEAAQDLGANVVITHHPVIFHPLKALRTDQPTGHFLATAIKHDIHVIACHTNLDSAVGGVSDILARNMGLEDIIPLVLANCETPSCGLGRTGRYSMPLSPDQCIERLKSSCHPPWLLEAGNRPDQVSTVAVCGGSCSDFAQAALESGADLFITAEVKHSIARWAEEAGLWIIDGGHFATEQPAMEPLRQRLRSELAQTALENRIYAAGQSSPLNIIT